MRSKEEEITDRFAPRLQWHRLNPIERHAVWKMPDATTQNLICLKIIDYTRCLSFNQATRLENNILKESSFLSLLDHPMIPRLINVSINGSFICMDYVAGKRLDLAMGMLTFSDKLNIFASLLDLAAYFQNQDVLHRDIKPRNMIVQKKDKRVELKIVDFGSMEWKNQSRVDHGPRKEKLGRGLYLFQPPEQLLSDYSRFDCRVDNFSLGATVYMTLFGSTPYLNIEPSAKEVINSYQYQENALWRSGKLQSLPFELGELLFQLLRVRNEARLRDVTDIQKSLTRIIEKATECDGWSCLA